MPISADKVRELAARPEGTGLDFKERDYDWTVPSKNNELAKDLMGMANMLGPGSSPAYILIGVKNDGTIVGVPPGSHPDDAVLHQKVQRLLNQTPTFSYGPVTVDGMSVGVYEIRAGGRPFFPLKDAPPLLRHVALYRNGSTTDVASPTMILEWAREDDPDAHAVRVLERRKLEAEAKMHVVLRSAAVSAGGDGVEFRLELENVGRAGFTFSTCRWTAAWNPKFHEELQKVGGWLPAVYQPPSREIALSRVGLLLAGQIFKFSISWQREDALEHLRAANLLLNGFSHDWAEYEFAVECVSEFGGRESATLTMRV